MPSCGGVGGSAPDVLPSLFLLGRAPRPQIHRHQFRGGGLPVMQGALRHLRLKPRQRLAFGCRVGVRAARAVRFQPRDVRPVQRVIVPPAVCGAECALSAWLEPFDRLGQQDSQDRRAFQHVIGRAVRAQRGVDLRQVQQRRGR